MQRLEPLTTRWWWLRHAPVPHLAHQIYGSTDVDCDTSDERAFRNLALCLPKEAVWFISHLRRTRQTAEAISEQGYELPELIQSELIGEQNFGELHGRLHSEHEASRKDPFVGYWPVSPHETAPGGESFSDVCDRVGSFIENANEEYSGRDIVCVTHGGPIRAAIRLALNLDEAHSVAFDLEYLSLTRIHHYPNRTNGAPAFRVQAIAESTHYGKG